MTSINALGGGARHSRHFRHFNHLPEIKPWVRAGARAPEGVAAIITHYMGEGFPVECVEGDIISALEPFAPLGAVEGARAFIEAGGREVRVILAAIRRNFKRYPERWAALREG